jgi:hypothetical protein
MLTWPASTSISAGPVPLYGTWAMSMPVLKRNSSPDMCTDWPRPDDANDSLPGLAFASATSSATVFAGTAGFTTSTLGLEITEVIGVISSGL